MEQTTATKSTTTTVLEYSTMSKEDFKKLILMGKSKTRYQLVYIILNTLHHIVSAASYYYYCYDNEHCKICPISIIFSNFEKDVEKDIFYHITFCFGITLKFATSSFNFLIIKKIVLDAFKKSMSSVVVTGTLANTGVYFSLKVFDTMKRSRLINLNMKNYLFHLNFSIRLLI